MKMSKPATEIILSPVLSEKSMDIASQGKYVFMVDDRASKIEIKRAIKELYGVTVTDVNIVKLPRKPKQGRGRRYFTRKRIKAVVTLAPGQTIPEITEAV